jgi:hypothetical protein
MSGGPCSVLLVYVAGALRVEASHGEQGEAGRGSFASRGGPRTLLLCAAAWLASLHAVRRRRVARRHFTSMMLLTKVRIVKLATSSTYFRTLISRANQHGGRGESQVPPHTRGIVSLLLSSDKHSIL